MIIMKRILKTMLLILIFMISSISCNKQELFVEEPVVVVDDDKPDDTGNTDDDDDDTDATLPCDFTLDNVAANSTIIIDCIMDLDGQTVNLPANVTLSYEGGDIINGTINFGDGGIIDGDLMNSTLTFTGSSPQVKDPVFTFKPDRWGIVEGKVSDEVALNNKNVLNSLISETKKLGVTTFEIDEMDAYFDVRSFLDNSKYSIERSISLPSDFTLKMSDKTHIRVQPNQTHSYILMGIYKGDNITVIGGNLYGDRWEHDYSPFSDLKNRPRNSHEWGHVFQIAGGRNIVVDGVHISDASGDGFGVHGSLIRNPDGTPQAGEIVSQNVTLRNSTVEASRRNGLSLLDGDGILIENCNIIDTAQGESPSGVEFSSAGTWPKYGISFEAWRQRVNGELREFNKIENVTLRGNTFTGNSAGDVVLYTCSKITIEDNFFDSRIGNIAAFDIVIRNNRFKARIEKDGKPYNYGISIASRIVEGQEMNYNYTISGNRMEGYGNAMILSGKDFKVHNNTFVNNGNALGLESLDGGEFYKNKFNSNVPISLGYFSRGGDLKNVSVRDEIINVDYRPINFRKIKAASGTPLTFTNCEMISADNKANFIEDCENISITDNIINTDFSIYTSQNIVIENNRSPGN